MGKRYRVTKASGLCQVVSAQFDSNGKKISGDTLEFKQGESKVVNDKTYVTGPRSPSNSTCCIFRVMPASGGNPEVEKEVWDENKGWTPDI